jgi:hypothetical protein
MYCCAENKKSKELILKTIKNSNINFLFFRANNHFIKKTHLFNFNVQSLKQTSFFDFCHYFPQI